MMQYILSLVVRCPRPRSWDWLREHTQSRGYSFMKVASIGISAGTHGKSSAITSESERPYARLFLRLMAHWTSHLKVRVRNSNGPPRSRAQGGGAGGHRGRGVVTT